MTARSLGMILLAEDDPDIQELALMALEDVGGLKFVAVDNGPAMLHEAERTVPDLIILDWMMPGLDGGQTLAALRARPATAKVPIIFMTAKARPDEIDRMLKLGAADVITKPFDPMELPDRVLAIWRRVSETSSDEQ